MADIPTHFARVPMEVSRLPRAPAGITDVGAGLEAEALGQFGAAMKDVGVDLLTKLKKKRTDSQLAEGGAAWESAHIKFFTDLAKDDDLENYEKKYNAFAKSLKRNLLHKSKRLTRDAQSKLTNWFTTNQPKMEKEVAIALMEKQDSQGRASMQKAIFDHERAGNATGALAAINAAEKDNYITAEQAEQQRQSVAVNIDWFTGLRMIDIDPREFLEVLQAAPEVEQPPVPLRDVEVGFLENLNPEQKLQLKARAERKLGTMLAQGKAIREQQINAEQGRLMNLARSGQLTDDIIRGSALDEFGTGSKNTFYNIIDARAKAALEDKDDPLLKSDPQVEARILDELRDPESKITEKDIADLVGKGLSVDDADRLIGRLDVFKGFWFKRADSYLKQNLGWSDTFVKFEHPEGGIAYSLAMDELFGAIETEKLKDKDLYDRARAIAIPYLIDYWEKALYLTPDKIARLTRMLKIKEPVPEKTGKQLSPLDELTFLRLSLSRESDKAVQEALDAGWSAQRVIDELIKPAPIKKQKAKKGTDLDPEGIFQ